MTDIPLTEEEIYYAGLNDLATTISSDPSLQAHVSLDSLMTEARYLASQPLTCLQDVFDRQQDIRERLYCPDNTSRTSSGRTSHWDSALTSKSTKYDAQAAFNFLLDQAWGTTHRRAKVARTPPTTHRHFTPPSVWPILCTQEKVDLLKKCYADRLYQKRIGTHTSESIDYTDTYRHQVIQVLLPVVTAPHLLHLAPLSKTKRALTRQVRKQPPMTLDEVVTATLADWSTHLEEYEVGPRSRFSDLTPTRNEVETYVRSIRETAT